MPAEWIRENHRLSEEQQRILCRIESTFLFMAADPADEAASVPWLRWQLEGMLPCLTLEDLTPTELMADVALTGMAFSRLLTVSPHKVGKRRPTGLHLV